jgi:hypothetical protein
MREVMDPVTDDDVRCGAGTKGRNSFLFDNILQTFWMPSSFISSISTLKTLKNLFFSHQYTLFMFI